MTHIEIRRRAGVEPMETMLVRRQLRWTGHVRRMPENRLPRRVFYGELAGGGRRSGGQRKRYNDLLAANMRACNMEPQQFEQLADSRDDWSNACEMGVINHVRRFDDASRTRRERRHRVRTPPTGQRRVRLRCMW